MGDTKFERRFFGGPVLYCVDCDNIAVQGEGIIDGQGSKWWRNPEDPRGYLAFFVNSTNIHISGLTFQVLCLYHAQITVALMRSRRDLRSAYAVCTDTLGVRLRWE